ncbi:hypothetical protein FOZ63_019158, partial [Perkinsus olseni]
RAKQEPWVLNEFGVPTQISTNKIPSWSEWKAAFRTFRLCLAMLGVATQAELDRYQAMVENLALTYRENWAEVYAADDMMRAVHLPRYMPIGQGATSGEIPLSELTNDAVSETELQTDIQLNVNDLEAEVCDDRLYLGGLRSAYQSSRLLPHGRIVLNELRSKFLKILDVDVVNAALGRLGSNGSSLFSAEVLKSARSCILEVCGGDAEEADWTMEKSPLRGKLIKRVAAAAEDWDKEVVRWLTGAGAPLGINLPIVTCDIFPPNREPVEGHRERETENSVRLAVPGEDFRNYPSAEENPVATKRLFEAERNSGFCRFFHSHAALKQELRGEPFVISKVALAEKDGVDASGNKRFRLIVDGSESGVNELTRTDELQQLPRLSDVIDDWKSMAECQEVTSNNSLFLVIDFQSAFKLVKTAPEELPWCVCFFDGVYILYDSIQFGFKASPLVWGRVSGLLSRMGQLVLSPDGREGRIHTYVDDPVISVCVENITRRRQFACLPLLLWEALGCPYSCQKGQCGTRVKWIGRELEVDNSLIRVYVPKDKLMVIEELLNGCSTSQRVAVKLLRKLCGKLTWAAQAAKQLTPFSAVAAEAANKTLVGIKSAAWAISWLSLVIRHFIAGDLDGDARYLIREFPLKRWQGRRPLVSVVVDACWRGIGGVLLEGPNPVSWFADIISSDDLLHLDIGESHELYRYQNAFELLAILVGTRIWAGRWSEDLPVLMRSDSIVAINAATRMKSRSPVINRVAMELAYDAVKQSRLLDMEFKHIPGV